MLKTPSLKAISCPVPLKTKKPNFKFQGQEKKPFPLSHKQEQEHFL